MSSSASASASASESPSVSPSPSPSPGVPEKLYTREANGTLPTDTTDLSTIYTTPEEGDVYDYDDRRVGIAGASGSYLMHLFKKTNENREDDIRVRAVVRSSYAPVSGPVYLQIWNGTTLTWETIATQSTGLADTDFSMDADVPTNDSNYYDFGNQVAVRVYQLNNSGVSKTLSIDQIVISFISRYTAQYSSVGSVYEETYPDNTPNYTEVYPTTAPTDYTPKYPSKNPQDDL